MSSPELHAFTCEMDLARTYLRHGRFAVAFECTEAAWDAARAMDDSYRMQEAEALQTMITIATSQAA